MFKNLFKKKLPKLLYLAYYTPRNGYDNTRQAFLFATNTNNMSQAYHNFLSLYNEINPNQQITTSNIHHIQAVNFIPSSEENNLYEILLIPSRKNNDDRDIF